MKRPLFLSLLLGVLLTGTTLRFWNLELHTLWFDEIDTIIPRADFATGDLLPPETRKFHDVDASLFRTLPRASLSELPRYAVRVSSYPPLYYASITLWRQAFGDSDVALRTLSGLAGTLALIVFFLLARSFLEAWQALLAAFLFAIQPLLVDYSRNARPYAILLLLMTASLWLLARRMESRPERGLAVALALVNAGILYTHYWGTLFVAGEVIAILLGGRRSLRLLWGYALTGLLYISGAVIAWQRVRWFGQPGHSTNWLRSEAGVPFFSRWLDGVLGIPKQLILGYMSVPGGWWTDLLGMLLYPALVYCLARGTFKLREKHRDAARLLVYAVLVPLLGMMAADLILRTNVSLFVRYHVCLVPPLLLLVVLATSERGIVARTVPLVLVALSVAGLHYHFTHPWQWQDWRENGIKVRSEAGPLGYVVVDDYHDYLLLARYADGMPRLAWKPELPYLEGSLRTAVGARVLYVPRTTGLPPTQRSRIQQATGDPEKVRREFPPDRLRLEPLVASGLLELEKSIRMPGAFGCVLIYRVLGTPARTGP